MPIPTPQSELVAGGRALQPRISMIAGMWRHPRFAEFAFRRTRGTCECPDRPATLRVSAGASRVMTRCP